MRRKYFFIFAYLLASLSAWPADGDYFWSTIAQGTQMSFTIISEADKTCEVGPGMWWNLYQTGGANTVKYTDGVERKTLAVPSTVTKEGGDTYTVIGIGTEGLASLSWITEIILPSTFKYIKDEAFANCTKLSTISIQDGVTSIGNYAFSNCYNLNSITLPNSVATIGENVFSYCIGLTSVSLSNNIEELPLATFKGCYTLSSIVLPDNIKKIGSFAFNTKADDNYNDIHGESNLQSVVANGVTELGYGVFDNCFKLASITMNNLTTLAARLTSDNPFADTKWWNDQNNCLVSLGKILLAYKGDMPAGTLLDIPNGITEIPEKFFKDYENLESVNIPQSIMSIGQSAFYGCTGLTSVTIPNSVTYIGDEAFNKCSKLRSITIPNSVTSIGGSAFSGCKSLESVTIPESITSIEDRTFSSCESLNSITLPEGLQSIGSYAFYSNKSLESINLPQSVKNIGSSAFSFCKKLSKVNSYIEEPFDISGDVFEYMAEKTTLYVPDGTKSKYEAKTGWNSFSKIIEYGSIVTHEQVKLDANMMLYTSTHPLDFSSPIEGLKAYIITDIVDNEQAVLTEIEEPFPEESPILLIGTANQQYSIPVGDEDYKYSELIFNSRLRIKDENFYGSNYAIYYVYNGTQFVKTSVNDLKDGDIYLMNYSMPSEASDVLVLTYAPTPKISEETQVELSSLGDKNLANNVVDGIYYNAGENSYNATEGCIVINNTTDMSKISDAIPGSADVKNNFTGLILRVAKGKGSIKVNAKTEGTAQLAVQVGNSTPVMVSKTERDDVVADYDVEEDTYVYIYAVIGSSSAPARRASSTDMVKIYGITVSPGVTAISTITNAQSAVGNYYTLDGQKLEGLPTKKGVYIVNGRKVVVK